MKRFKRILLCVEPGSDASAAVEEAVSLAERNEGTLTLLSIASSEHADRENLPLVRRREAEQVLEQIRARVPQSSLVFGTGDLVETVLEEQGRREHDLVIKTASNDGWLNRFLKRSADIQLMRRSLTPVWLVGDRGPRETASESVVAAVNPADLTEHGRALNHKILQLASSLARDKGRPLVVLHCWQAPGGGIVAAKHGEAAARSYKASARLRAFQLTCDLIGEVGLGEEDCQLRFAEGPPDYAIPRFLERVDAGPLVMGTVARTGLPGWVLGNTAEAVLHQVRSPVLAVRFRARASEAREESAA